MIKAVERELARKTKRTQRHPRIGPELDPPFRGLRHEPVTEQGVVLLFGMVFKELHFRVDAIQQGYPDCSGSRASDTVENSWENVRIEFEYRSSRFFTQGHDPDGCDLIVCWKHDWEDCPKTLKVLELSKAIKRLPRGRS